MPSSSRSIDLRKDVLYSGRPDEGLRLVVIRLDVMLDGGDQFGNGVERVAANALAGEFAEPSLDEVEPGGTGRGEVQMESRMFA